MWKYFLKVNGRPDTIQSGLETDLRFPLEFHRTYLLLLPSYYWLITGKVNCFLITNYCRGPSTENIGAFYPRASPVSKGSMFVGGRFMSII